MLIAKESKVLHLIHLRPRLEGPLLHLEARREIITESQYVEPVEKEMRTGKEIETGIETEIETETKIEIRTGVGIGTKEKKEVGVN